MNWHKNRQSTYDTRQCQAIAVSYSIYICVCFQFFQKMDSLHFQYKRSIRIITRFGSPTEYPPTKYNFSICVTFWQLFSRMDQKGLTAAMLLLSDMKFGFSWNSSVVVDVKVETIIFRMAFRYLSIQTMKKSLIELKNGEDVGISQEERNMSFLVCNRCASWHLTLHTSYMSESTGYEYISECFVMTHNAHTCIRMKELLSARCVRECR